MWSKVIPRVNNLRYAWWSDDDFLWPEATFYDSQNINAIKKPKSVQLSIKIEDYASTTYAWNITKILELPSWNSLVFTDEWEIAYKGAVVSATLSSNPVIYNAVVFTSFVFVFTAWKIHKLAFATFFGGAITTTENVFTFTSWNTRDCYIPVFNVNDTFCYFASSNFLYSFDNALTWITTETTLEAWSKIVWLTEYSDRLKVFVNYNNKDCYILFWNTDWSERVYYKWKLIKCVVSDWTNDYIVAWDNIYAWHNLQPIAKECWFFTYTGTRAKGNPLPQNSIAMNDELCYVLADDWIVTVWNYHIWYPKWVFKEWKFTNKPSSIEYMTISNTIYFWYWKKLRKIASWYEATGYVESRKYYWSLMSQQKDVNCVFIAYDLTVWKTDSINIYFSPNWWSEELVATITDTSKHFQYIYANEYSRSRNYWKLKLKLNSNDWTTTPSVYEITMFYTIKDV